MRKFIKSIRKKQKRKIKRWIKEVDLKEMSDGCYEVSLYCENCLKEGRLHIPKGMKISEFHCPWCRCQTMKKN